MADKFITRACDVVLTSGRGPALHQTQNPMPDALIFTLTNRITGQSVTLDEEMAAFLFGEIQKEISNHIAYIG